MVEEIMSVPVTGCDQLGKKRDKNKIKGTKNKNTVKKRREL